MAHHRNYMDRLWTWFFSVKQSWYLCCSRSFLSCNNTFLQIVSHNLLGNPLFSLIFSVFVPKVSPFSKNDLTFVTILNIVCKAILARMPNVNPFWLISHLPYIFCLRKPRYTQVNSMLLSEFHHSFTLARINWASSFISHYI